MLFKGHLYIEAPHLPVTRVWSCTRSPVITHSRGFNHWAGCPGQGRKNFLLHTNIHHRMLEKPPDPSDPIHQGNRFRRSRRGEEFERLSGGFPGKILLPHPHLMSHADHSVSNQPHFREWAVIWRRDHKPPFPRSSCFNAASGSFRQ